LLEGNILKTLIGPLPGDLLIPSIPPMHSIGVALFNDLGDILDDVIPFELGPDKPSIRHLDDGVAELILDLLVNVLVVDSV